MSPYYSDDAVSLYHGDFREILPTLNLTLDLLIADPPYGETSLEWDKWPDGWPSIAAGHARSMWCYGSMRMFLDRRDEFTNWTLSQDVVWEKHNGSSLHSDRFIRYGAVPGALVADIFAGSGSTGVAAKMSGRKAVLFEVREDQCEKAANRLSQDFLDFDIESFTP